MGASTHAARGKGIPAGLLLAVVALTGCAGARRSVPTGRMTPAAPPSAMPIVQIGDPVLRSRASEVPADRIGAPDFQELVQRMIATMRAAPGVGLAAPQVGVPWRVVVLEDREEYVGRLTEEERRERGRAPFEVRILVNPVLRAIGDERATFFEGCLSVAGFVALVDRAAEVEVEALDERGVPRTWRVKGWPARILQHEIDHLDGTLYVDRMKARSFSTADQAKARFGGKPIEEIRRELGL